jgi:hypothetical protein
MNKEFATNSQAADTAATGYGDSLVKAINDGSQVPSIKSGKDASYSGPQGVADYTTGKNDVEKAYENAANQNDKYTTFEGSRNALKSELGYGSGFAALDGFLGQRQAGGMIANNANSNKAALQTGITNGQKWRGLDGAEGRAIEARGNVQRNEALARNEQAAIKKAQQDASSIPDAIPDVGQGIPFIPVGAYSAPPITAPGQQPYNAETPFAGTGGFVGTTADILASTPLDMAQQPAPPPPPPKIESGGGRGGSTRPTKQPTVRRYR